MIHLRLEAPRRHTTQTVEEQIAEQLIQIGDELTYCIRQQTLIHRGADFQDFPSEALRKVRQFVVSV